MDLIPLWEKQIFVLGNDLIRSEYAIYRAGMGV